jgi:hypothetical protein
MTKMDPTTRRLLGQTVDEATVTLTPIRDWAEAEDGGTLPEPSARAFALWLNEEWNDWTEDGETTVKDAFEGAVAQWCGGRTFR